MTNDPRWAASQTAVEAALARGPQTVAELVQVTGYSEAVVRRAVQRNGITEIRLFWPRQYALPTDAPASPEGVRTVQYVKPTEIPRSEIGQRWQEGKLQFSKDLQKIDLYKLNLDQSREQLRAATAALLGVLVVLDQIEDGPEWRMEIGL